MELHAGNTQEAILLAEIALAMEPSLGEKMLEELPRIAANADIRRLVERYRDQEKND